jgi:MFS family permease
MSMNVSMVLGPAVAGLLVATVGVGATVAFDAATFLVSGLTLLRLRPRPVPASARTSFVAELKGGLAEVRQRQWVMATLVLFSAYHALVIPAIYVLGPSYAEQERGGAGAWGIITAGFGIGAVLGGVVALRWRPERTGLFIAGFVTVAGFQAVIVTAALPTLVVAGLEALTGLCVAVGFTLWDTALQQHVPPEAQSRVSSFDHLISVALMPVGYIFMGPLALAVGVHTTSLLATVITIAVGLAVLAVPAQRRLTAVRVGWP